MFAGDLPSVVCAPLAFLAAASMRHYFPTQRLLHRSTSAPGRRGQSSECPRSAPHQHAVNHLLTVLRSSLCVSRCGLTWARQVVCRRCCRTRHRRLLHHLPSVTQCQNVPLHRSTRQGGCGSSCDSVAAPHLGFAVHPAAHHLQASPSRGSTRTYFRKDATVTTLLACSASGYYNSALRLVLPALVPCTDRPYRFSLGSSRLDVLSCSRRIRTVVVNRMLQNATDLKQICDSFVQSVSNNSFTEKYANSNAQLTPSSYTTSSDHTNLTTCCNILSLTTYYPIELPEPAA